ncbi:uncharacterized protein N7496_010442 [Penicillium cataractarum]|uniref:Helitron helicase-like domain-containing protein n=1 Tax=Penicillium cataractarum TaxID=2100454 RepID=A0A9W9RTI3_9EURO|nr:uncharacterized protein N7496_010442 [Penicillium cataractarum]KAJ5364729.1 hypothetical protein N7496_010442 [Penicillium cataractarum]
MTSSHQSCEIASSVLTSRIITSVEDNTCDANIGEPFITGSVSTDINGERQDPNLRVLDALFSVITNGRQTLSEATSAEKRAGKMPVISYTIQGQATLVDHWSNPHYFTAAFPTLFPTGNGGHLDERAIPVSLGAFTEWALSHYSRRCLPPTDNVVTGQKIKDPIIRRLLRNIVAIGMQVPGSFAQKLRLRSEIRGQIIRYGMPAFWITINPSDLRNPLVLILAGIEYSRDNLATVNAAIREATTTSNPTAIAEFFHHIGILSELSNHFAVIEINGRVRYLESIIIQGINETILHDPKVNIPSTPLSAQDFESDNDFHLRLSYNSNYIARKTQVHSKHHLATYFKYR